MKKFKRLGQFNPSTQSQELYPMQFAILVLLIILIVGLSFYAYHKKSKVVPYPVAIMARTIPITHKAHMPWKLYIVKPHDTLASVFTRANLSKKTYHAVIQLPEAKKYLAHLLPMQKIQLQFNKAHELLRLSYAIDQQQTLIVAKKNEQYIAKVFTTPLIKKLEVISGTIRNSLFTAMHRSGLPSGMFLHFVDIFGWKIDFKRQIRSGDQFKIIYEVYFAEGNPVKIGNIIAAEFVNRHKVYDAIRYRIHSGHVDYYMPDGNNLRQAFLRAPLKYTRVSSPFNSRRMHPILHIVRPHEGVDLAAPLGTPIKASGDGTIVFEGRKGGYGKTIVIQHGRKYSTLYAHMSRFSSHYHTGSHVLEGHVIGYVGQTGMATGPHLHYEFRINGIRYDPLKVKLPSANPVPKVDRNSFVSYAKQMVAQLNRISFK